MFEPEDDNLLAELAGIDIQLAADGTIQLAESVQVEDIATRPLDRLRTVALDPSACVPANFVQYSMYHGVVRRRDRERVAATGLRYDLTLMSPRTIGRERSKTLGHRHNRPTHSTLDYPEIYEVLSGTAWIVLQTLDEKKRSAPFCVILQAHPGDKVVIPPNLYHFTINASDQPLLFSAVIPMGVRGIYQPLTDLRGAGWLNTTDQGWIKNPSYRHVADLNWWTPTAFPDLGLTQNRPLYHALVQSPESLLWLLEPMSFPDMFPDIWDNVAKIVLADS